MRKFRRENAKFKHQNAKLWYPLPRGNILSRSDTIILHFDFYILNFHSVPSTGLEPVTNCLRGNCSAN